MLKLIKLELKRNNMRTYLLAGAVIFLLLLGFIYLIAIASHLEDTTAAGREMGNYAMIFKFVQIMSLIIFGVMSSIMYSRLVTDEYTGKKAALLFSYPVSRKKILLAKLLLVFGFTSVLMLLSTASAYIIFGMTESVQIVVQDVMTAELAADTLKALGIAVLALGGIGIMSLRIGFIKKSIPVAIITALTLSAIYGNAIIGANNLLINFLIGVGGFAVAAVITAELSNKINRMEVE